MYKAPFGSDSARFTTVGVHPNLLATGRMPYDSQLNTETSKNVGPGSYDILKYSTFSEKNLTKKADGPNWERAYQTEKLAKMPHLLYQETFKKKLEDKKRLGPGHYNIKHISENEAFKSYGQHGMLDSFSDRWAADISNSNPGPGAYGIPDHEIEEKRKNKPGKVPLFERSKEPRSLPSVGCEVPPGSYNHKNSIDQLIEKKVSTRGPYDVFSENRSKIKWGHFAQDNSNQLGPGQYQINSFTDDMNDIMHKKHGKFGKIAQYPDQSGDRLSINNTSLRPRNPKWPGPGHYTPGDVDEFSKFPTKSPPFLISTQRSSKRSQKFFNNNFNSVGVGRYDIEKLAECEANRKLGIKSVFVSKSTRIPSAKSTKYLTERLKPHNLDDKSKMNLYLYGNVNGNSLTSTSA